MTDLVAIHEAGHCVIANALAEPVGSVAIEADGSGSFYARVGAQATRAKPVDREALFAIITSGLSPSRERREFWRSTLIVCAAGLMAQRRLDPEGQYDSWCDDDRMRAKAIASRICSTDSEAQQLIAATENEALELVNQYWREILSVAELLELRRQLDRNQILEAIADARLAPAARARRRWEAEIREGAERFTAQFGDLQPL